MEIANQLLQTNDIQIINLQNTKCLHQKSIQVNNRKYILQLIKNLHNNSPYKSNHNIFYLALLYFEIISSNPKTKSTINNQDIIALCCFYIAIKSSIVQFEMITISQLKCILNKYKSYSNNFILLSEIKCISLLDYRINYMTCYDYLLYYYRESKSIDEVFVLFPVTLFILLFVVNILQHDLFGFLLNDSSFTLFLHIFEFTLLDSLNIESIGFVFILLKHLSLF